MEPLSGHLRAGMKVTIAFDDVSLPLPAMAKPDIRQTVIEVVLERLERGRQRRGAICDLSASALYAGGAEALRGSGGFPAILAETPVQP